MSIVMTSSAIDFSEDIEPPFGSFFSAKYKRSLAFKALNEQTPKIIESVINSLIQNKVEILKKYGTEASEELENIIENIKKLKTELLTNQPLLPLKTIPDSNADDAPTWNNKIRRLSEDAGVEQRWYNTKWFIAETYMYRRLAQEFLFSKHFKSYDWFKAQKQEAYFKSAKSISYLTHHMMTQILNQKHDVTSEETKNILFGLFKLSLWGNRCDLYLTTGVVTSQEHNPLEILQSNDHQILIDDSEKVWKLFEKKSHTSISILDIVLDNSGYEFFTDLCLAAFLVEKKITKKIRFYVKRFPWFNSDVTARDFHWLIKEMKKSDDKNTQTFGESCESYLKNGSWTVEEESYWTEPFDFSEMKNENPTLYNKMSESTLIILKGDLNYGKLMGDIKWRYSTSFAEAIREFKPTNLLSLRTIKSDVCVGLTEEKAKSLFQEDPKWDTTGTFGIIQSFIKLDV